MANISKFLPAFFFLGGLFTPGLSPAKDLLKLEKDVPLTGGVSRFDYQSLDSQNGILYLSHMGAGQIIVFNTKTDQVLATLSGFPGVTGLLVLPELHRLYANVTRRHQTAVVDTQSLKVLSHVPSGHFPDGMDYVPELRQLYVSDEIGGEENVIEVATNKRVASLKMGGQVGNTRYDPVSRLIFAPIQTKNELAVINPSTGKVTGKYPLQGGKSPHGLWIEPDTKLAFLACEWDDKLVVMDLTSYKEIAVFDVGKEPDVLSYDPGLKILYVACERGKTSVFSVKDRKVEKLGEVEVGENAHSVQVDPQTHRVYFPLRKAGKGPVLRIMKPDF
jgi:DNA-binding beta-propeller fold protein YncE